MPIHNEVARSFNYDCNKCSYTYKGECQIDEEEWCNMKRREAVKK